MHSQFRIYSSNLIVTITVISATTTKSTHIHLAYTQKFRKIKFNFHFRQKIPPETKSKSKSNRQTNEKNATKVAWTSELVFIWVLHLKSASLSKDSLVFFFYFLFFSALKRWKWMRTQNKHRKNTAEQSHSIASIVEKKSCSNKSKEKKRIRTL